jgi:hypothetical protein
MSEQLLPPPFLFRYSAPLRRHTPLWSASGANLPEACRLKSFGELEGKPMFADLRAAWSDEGLAFSLAVKGKSQPPWCRDTRIDESDGLQVWIDTRNTQTIHRAGRFCHRFAFLPQGAGRRLDEPVAALLAINRAKESPREIDQRQLRAVSQRTTDGYTLQAFIPTAALTGFAPADHPALGFCYAVIDRELGWQTFALGPEFPFDEDPSLWGTLELTGK